MDHLLSILAAPFSQLLSLGNPFSIYSLAGAFLTAALWYALRPRRRATTRVRAFLRKAFSPRIWAHRSAMLDYKMFFFAAFFFATGIVQLFAVSHGADAATRWALSQVTDPAAPPGEAGVVTTAVLALVFVATYDLGYWFAHWLLHRFPVLWEFHKVHHSAEVMTPFTEWRQHPVELLLFPLCVGTATGALYAGLDHLFGLRPQNLSLFWVNSILILYMMTLLHLRHTHLWLPAKGWLGRIIQSPAHHQIHHSTDPKHFDKNLGLCLSIWDWCFGTLYVPNERETIEFGIGAEGHEHNGVAAALWLPVRRAASRLKSHAAKFRPPAIGLTGRGELTTPGSLAPEPAKATGETPI